MAIRQFIQYVIVNNSLSATTPLAAYFIKPANSIFGYWQLRPRKVLQYFSLVSDFMYISRIIAAAWFARGASEPGSTVKSKKISARHAKDFGTVRLFLELQ